MNQQESGSLREALKKLRLYCGKFVDDPTSSEDEQVAYDDVCIQIAQILAAHPEEPAREPSDAAAEAGANELYERLFHLGITMTEAESATRAALEAAYRVDAPRPVRSVEPTGEAAEDLQRWYASMDDEDADESGPAETADQIERRNRWFRIAVELGQQDEFVEMLSHERRLPASRLDAES